jgi:hypothetical protein
MRRHNHASATSPLQANLTCFEIAIKPSDSAASQLEEGSMAWLTATDAEIEALIGARMDVVGLVVGVIDAASRREVAA